MSMPQPHHSFPETFPWIFDIWLSAIKYLIEVHNSAGDLVAILHNAHNIRYTEGINQAPVLNFSLPADDDKVDYIIKANEIWLRNYEEETPSVVAKFRLTRRIDGRESTLITTAETEGLLNQLADEQLVTEYSAESLTVNQIVTALLALQVISPNITEGTIAPADTVSIKFSVGETILHCLYSLRDKVGGYIYVDNDRALQWANSIGVDTGQQVRYQKNLVGVTRSIDYTTIANRIYAFGVGSGRARIKLSDVQANDYVEDVGSQTEWGGIFVKVLVNPSITDAAALLAWATLELADRKDPIITYTIDTTDLGESTEAGFEFEPLELGSIITVIDEDLGLDVSVHIVQMTHPDLLHPEIIQVEVTNLNTSNPNIKTRDIIDVISETLGIVEQELEAPPDPTLQNAVEFVIDGGGVVISTGEKGHIRLPFAGVIISAGLIADQSGDIVIDIWKDTLANFPPTDADSITASAPLTLSSADDVLDESLTGWTKEFLAGDVLAFNVDSCVTIQRVTVILFVRRT